MGPTAAINSNGSGSSNGEQALQDGLRSADAAISAAMKRAAMAGAQRLAPSRSSQYGGRQSSD